MMREPEVLNIGSLNLDYVYQVEHFVHPGETLSADEMHIYPGGKGLNQTIALSKAGAKVRHAGAIGKDGTWLLDILKAAGVNTGNIAVLDEISTGHAMIQNSSDGENSIVLYPGANWSLTRERISNALDALQPGDWVLLQNEINDVPWIMDQAHERNLKIALTPAPMKPEVRTWPLEKADLLFVNEGEAQALEGILETLPGEVITTLGSKGTIVSYQDREYFQPALKAKVKDTTAAGDTFAGYYLAGRIKNQTVEDCLKLAAAAASIAIESSGAAVSIPKLEAVRKRLQEKQD